MNKVEVKTGNQTEPPIVEIDTEASCAYVRFTQKPVERTVTIKQGTLTANADLDAIGEVVGLEVTGLEEFTIDTLMGAQGMGGILGSIPTRLPNRTQYISARRTEERNQDDVDLQMIEDRANEPTISGDQVFKELGL